MDAVPFGDRAGRAFAGDHAVVDGAGTLGHPPVDRKARLGGDRHPHARDHPANRKSTGAGVLDYLRRGRAQQQ